MVSKSKEAEERMHQLNRNTATLSQVESKISKIDLLYNELQKKAEVVETKELKIKDIVNTIEENDHFAQHLKEDTTNMKKEIDNIFKKSDVLNEHVQDMQMRLQDVKKGEEKIDEVLSRFSEIEILSIDLESRLKQMENATVKLDAAEARVKKLLNIMESPDTLSKAVKKAKISLENKNSAYNGVTQDISGQFNNATYSIENIMKSINPSKRDSILRFKKSGHKAEVIANILEMRPEEVEAVLKHYATK